MTIPANEAGAVERTSASFARPGPTLNASQRHRAAAVSRSMRSRLADDELVRADGDSTTEATVDEVIAKVTTGAQDIRPNWIQSLPGRGLEVLEYLELVSVVARLQAIDTFHFALGAAPAELPEPSDGQPTGVIDETATINGGWVPTAGRASAPASLSALPTEMDLMFDLHGALYLTLDGMADLDADRGLHRTQMELVAARTSKVNDCFY